MLDFNRVLLFNLKVDSKDPVLEFSINWVREIAKNCDHVDLVTLEYSGEYIANNVSIFSLGKENGVGKVTQMFNLYKITTQLLLKHRYLFCFAHMNYSFIAYIGWLIRLKGIKIITWYAHRQASFLLRVATLFSNIIVATNKNSFPIKTAKLFELGQGIDIKKYKSGLKKNEAHEKKLLFVGRISAIKQVEVLIKAIKILILKNHPIKLFIIGDYLNSGKAYYLQLKNLIAEENLEKHIIFLGKLSNQETIPYYQNCFAHINCSPNNHSVDKTILEAMACGSLSLSSVLAAKPTMGKFSPELFFKDGNELDLALKLEYWFMQDNLLVEKAILYLQNRVGSMHALHNLVDKLFLIGRKDDFSMKKS